MEKIAEVGEMSGGGGQGLGWRIEGVPSGVPSGAPSGVPSGASGGEPKVRVGGVGSAEWGHLQGALPGEWASMVVIVAGLALVGAMIILAAYVRHERGVVRRGVAREAYMRQVGRGETTGDGP